MWGDSGPEPDPGGGKGGDGSTVTSSQQEFIDLKDQFEQQQVLIAQLKEMLRKTENTSVTQEKVEEYANTLTRMSARVKKNRLERGEQGDDSASSETPASEKIMLLRQQLEENKLRLAQRGKFQKGIEETVTQLKAQLDDSQQLISLTPIKPSAGDTRTDYSIQTSHEELYNLLVIKDKKIAELNTKLHKLEANVLDLQENLKEKDSVIDARTKAIALMSESLSKKGKNTLDALDDTKEQMRKMQENFVTLEMEMKAEKVELQNCLEQKIALVTELESANFTLDRNNVVLQEEIRSYQSKLNEVHVQETEALQDPAELKEKEIFVLKEENSGLKVDLLRLQNEVKAQSENVEPEIEVLRNRISELEALNTELSRMEGSSRDSPQRNKKGKRGQKGKSDLQKIIDNLKEDCDNYKAKVMEHELTIQELNTTVLELQTVSKPLPVETEDVAKLKKQIDESNKNMIKIKAQHKSKIKELSKKIEELKKGDANQDCNAEYQCEIAKLKEHIEILDRSKEELALKLETDAANVERIKELEAQLFEQSELLDTKDQSLETLESQLKSYKTELLSLSERFNKLSNVENDQVASEMTSIHFEEQLDNLELEKKALIEKNNEIVLEKELLLEKLDNLMKEKQEISSKLDHYMQENMDLIDKLEKLSAEKVSSAESIEMVENLTQQEKLELEEYQHSLELASGNIIESLDPNPELNESVNQLTEETCDLLRKIELFTEERKEVMEKMETLAAENSQLNMKVQEIENNRDVLSETYEQLQNEKEAVEQERTTLKLLEQELNNEINQLRKENEILKQEIKSGSENEQSVSFENVMPLESDDAKNAELQKQIDEYRSLIEMQKSEIKELNAELLSYKDLPAANRELHEKITTLEEQYEVLKSENDNLSKTVNETSHMVHEKQVMEADLIAARKRIDEFDGKLTENLEELQNYKTIIEENREELISSSNIIADLQDKVHEKQNEVMHYQNEVSHLNSVIAELNSALLHLEAENLKSNEYSNTNEIMSGQLQEFKILLNENINQIEVYQQELQQNSVTIVKLNTQLQELNNKLVDMEHELECKDDEISKLNKERDNKEVMIVNLQSQLKQKEEQFHSVCESLNEKYLSLQTQIEQNAGSLSNIKDPLSKIEALETKNKEQLEKMKKIAANLKRKSTAYIELEQKCKDLNQKVEAQENEKQHLQSIVNGHEEEIKSQMQHLKSVEEKFVSELNNRSQEIVSLKQNFDELQDANRELESQLNALRTETELQHSAESNFFNIEINEKNEVIEDLNRLLENTQYQAETNANALQAKLSEMEMVVENQEAEISKLKEKVNILEEFLSTIEERRLSLEKQAVELNAQLLEKSNSYEEISQAEDLLEQRLAAVTAHDEQVQKRLHDMLKENQELMERNQRLMEENDDLKHHLSEATEKNLQSSLNLEALTTLQGELSHLTEVIARLENENKHLHDDYERKLKERMKDIEMLESEQQSQVEQIAGERKMLVIQLEQKEDELREYGEKQSFYMDEIESYKQKLDQQQIDFEEQITEFEKLSEEHKKNLRIIEELNGNYRELKNKNDELGDLIRLRDEEIQRHTLEISEIKNQVQHHLQINSELTQENSNLVVRIQELDQKREEPKVEEPVPISTFVWSDVITDDPFDFVKKNDEVEPVLQQITQVPVQSENKGDEKSGDLSLKIKSLEFLLYNTEIEKEDLLVQCQKLTSEIANLIYEKQNLDRSDVNVCHKCRCLVSDNQELNEQIIPPKDVAMTETDLKQLHQVEFEQTKPCIDTPDANLLPITEDVIPMRSTYLCYPSSQSQLEESINQPSTTHLDVFDENDDGWGCGTEEAKLEEVYQQQTGTSAFNQNLNLHIEEWDEKVRALEMERDRHLEEIKQLQIKSGKLIKKLKEYKAANDKLTSDIKRLDFVGLDDAIQDELQSKIQHLEKRIKDTTAELQKEKMEKSNLIQKVSGLQANNDRMTDAKEKQNVDLLMLQRRNNELTAKLEQFEWGSEGFDSPAHAKKDSLPESNASIDSYAKKIEELNETVKELTLDNEELQTMLEEQRMLRLTAEKNKAVATVVENMKTESEYLEVVTERNLLKDQLLSSTEDKKRAQEELNSLIKLKAELEINHDRLKEEKANIEMQLSQISLTLENNQRQSQEYQEISNTELEESKQRILKLSNQVNTLENSCQDLQLRILQMEESVRLLNEEKAKILKQLEEKDAELGNLKALLSESEVRKSGLENVSQQVQQLTDEKMAKMLKQLEEKDAELGNLKALLSESEVRKSELENVSQQVQQLTDEKMALVEQIKMQEAELVEKSSQLEEANLERTTYASSLQQLSEEWSQQVDQRGSDVAESWKLHLEAQETEFAQVQNRLQKEVNDLEEKCNVLVNENNELRRNVDAEIKNEVDKISALQQQITSCQQYINELTHSLQECQTKVGEQEQQLNEYQTFSVQANNQIQEKENEITKLNELLSSLQIEHAEKVGNIAELNEKLQSTGDLQCQLDKHVELQMNLENELIAKQSTVDQILLEIQQKDTILAELNEKLQQIDVLENEVAHVQSQLEEKLVTIDLLSTQVNTHNANADDKDKKIVDLTNQILQQTALLAENQKQISDLVSEVDGYKQLNEILQSKESTLSALTLELNNLKILLSEKEKEYNYQCDSLTQQSLQSQSELKAHYDKQLRLKDSELETANSQLLEHMHGNEALNKALVEQESMINTLNTELRTISQECEELNQKLAEEEALNGEENKQLTQLKLIIEEQVFKIEELKQELFEKSKDYDSLIAQLDLRKPSIQQHLQQPESVYHVHSERTGANVEGGGFEGISRAELDLAHYMLHQRDVRCEELTVELLQLLEERDTLQLKLSNAIREKEELRRKYTPELLSESVTEEVIKSTSSSPSKQSINITVPTPIELTQAGDGDHLANKLSELKSVGYRRDKTLLDEQEQRQLLQFSLMQQHRDVASRLPPEAAARLVQDASYTLSRDVQSPSKVVLNWLWGKSTPKVNDI